MDFVPRWLIFQKVDRGGQRLSPRPKLPVSMAVVPSPTKSSPSDSHLTSIGFDNWEWRFWGVDMLDDEPWMCVCRSCEMGTLKKDERQKHIQAGCATVLVSAYKLLLKDSKCVACDKVTPKKQWGVPLCSDRCVHIWKYEMDKITSVGEALDLVTVNRVI